MNFYQDCYIWHDGDYSTRTIMRVDAPFIAYLRSGCTLTHILPESRAIFRLIPRRPHRIREDIEVQLCSDDLIWRQRWIDEGWSDWRGVRYDPKVFREPPPYPSLWDKLLGDSP